MRQPVIVLSGGVRWFGQQYGQGDHVEDEVQPVVRVVDRNKVRRCVMDDVMQHGNLEDPQQERG